MSERVSPKTRALIEKSIAQLSEENRKLRQLVLDQRIFIAQYQALVRAMGDIEMRAKDDEK